ncbi:hypothetical protein GEMRC1_013501 [Eukaryota sp. GEM-RC1]
MDPFSITPPSSIRSNRERSLSPKTPSLRFNSSFPLSASPHSQSRYCFNNSHYMAEAEDPPFLSTNEVYTPEPLSVSKPFSATHNSINEEDTAVYHQSPGKGRRISLPPPTPKPQISAETLHPFKKVEQKPQQSRCLDYSFSSTPVQCHQHNYIAELLSKSKLEPPSSCCDFYDGPTFTVPRHLVKSD